MWKTTYLEHSPENRGLLCSIQNSTCPGQFSTRPAQNLYWQAGEHHSPSLGSLMDKASMKWKFPTYPIALGNPVNWFDCTTSLVKSLRYPISCGSDSSLFSSMSNTRSFRRFPMLAGNRWKIIFHVWHWWHWFQYLTLQATVQWKF